MLMKPFIFALIFSTLGAVTRAGDDQVAGPKSSAARQALAKAEKRIAEADAAWRKATAEANRQLVAELKTAQQTAMKNGDLDDANAIKQEIEKAQGNAVEPSAK